MDDFFEKALSFTLRKDIEGGYVNNPNDSGGATNFGITQGVYNEWRKSKSLPIQSVKYIAQDEVKDIYYNKYWKVARCDKIPSGNLAVAVFDWAVNSGCSRAVFALQKLLGVASDGIIGPNTIESIKAHIANDEEGVVKAYLDSRVEFFHSIAHGHNAVFLNGWVKRVQKLENFLYP